MLALAAGKRNTGERLSNPVLETEARVTVILVYALREARHAWAEAA